MISSRSERCFPREGRMTTEERRVSQDWIWSRRLAPTLRVIIGTSGDHNTATHVIRGITFLTLTHCLCISLLCLPGSWGISHHVILSAELGSHTGRVNTNTGQGNNHRYVSIKCLVLAKDVLDHHNKCNLSPLGLVIFALPGHCSALMFTL